MSRDLVKLSMLLVAVLAVSGCFDDDDGPVAPVEPRGSVRFHLKHVVGGQDLEFDDILFTNAFGKRPITTISESPRD